MKIPNARLVRRAVQLAAALAPLAAASTALAQFNNQWASFTNDPNRIKNPNGTTATQVTGNGDEKDFAVGDLNRDGWTDVVMVCKEPVSTTGRRVNYLLMNESGILVDRTSQWATASDVAGDLGFNTPTNDRDVQIVDLNQDGWPDVVTGTTLSDGQPKHISHPRVYVNQGLSGGVWQGLRHEDARIPQLLTIPGNVPVAPRFCSVSAADVTGDGAPDLYFADYDGTETGIGEAAGTDLNDRLLVNDGNGNFADSGTSRMSSTMLLSSFGTASEIVDMNGDGARDIVKVTTLGSPIYVSVAYNDPANVGFFNLFQNNAGGGSPYHVNVGDLNKDGRPDIVVSDDGADYVKYNTGNDALGRVIWGPSKTFQFLTGGDDGFGGTNAIVDLDLDGWGDAIVADVDVDLPGCGRRCKIYHNPGGAVGAQITLVEEAQQASGGWRGVVGMQSGDQIGTFDVAVLDLDRDGDPDMVFGRCSGTFVWINQMSNCAFANFGTAVANSTGAPASIGFAGTSSRTANHMVLKCTQLPANKTCLFFYGTLPLGTGAPFGNGLRWIGGTIQRLPVLQSDATGNATFACDFNAFPLNTLNVAETRHVQCWNRDPAAGGANYNASDALTFTVCP